MIMVLPEVTKVTSIDETPINLSSEYMKMRRSYAMMKQRSSSESSLSHTVNVKAPLCSIENNGAQKGSYHLKLTVETPPDVEFKSSTFGKAEQQFIRELKTSGLRATKEKSLLHSFNDLISTYRESIRAASTSVKQWKSHVNDIDDSWSDVVQEMEGKMKDQNDIAENLELELEEMRSSNGRFEEIVLNLKEELQNCLVEKENLVQQNEVKMNNFLDEMERRVDSFHEQMNAEKIKIESEMKKRYELEKQREREEIEKSFTDSKTGWMKQKEMYEDTVQECRCELEEKDNAISKMTSELKEMECALKVQQDKLEKTRNLAQEYDEFKLQREEELNLVEQRIKHIMSLKEKKLEAAQFRAREAEMRAVAFEKCISNIEYGFEELPQDCSMK